MFHYSLLKGSNILLNTTVGTAKKDHSQGHCLQNGVHGRVSNELQTQNQNSIWLI